VIKFYAKNAQHPFRRESLRVAKIKARLPSLSGRFRTNCTHLYGYSRHLQIKPLAPITFRGYTCVCRYSKNGLNFFGRYAHRALGKIILLVTKYPRVSILNTKNV